MCGDGAAGEDDQAVGMMDEIGDDAAGLGKALGWPICGAGRGSRAFAARIGDQGQGVHVRPRALPVFASATRGISCDCSQS